MHLRTTSWSVSLLRTRLIRLNLSGHQLCSILGNEVEFTRRLQIVHQLVSNLKMRSWVAVRLTPSSNAADPAALLQGLGQVNRRCEFKIPDSHGLVFWV